MSLCTYQFIENEFDKQQEVIQKGLAAFNNDLTGLRMEQLGLFCYDNQDIIGGLVGYRVARSFNIKLLWVDEAHRGKRIGTALIEKIEAHAKEKEINTLFVDTLSFQAPDFYTACGFKQIAFINKYFDEYDRVFYRKELI